MTDPAIRAAVQAAHRFIEAAWTALADRADSSRGTNTVLSSGSCLVANFRLTRALADMRKP